jgi:hypothetical protein
MATATARRRRAIEHVIATDFARDRLVRAAFDVVVDALDLSPIAVRTSADRVWVTTAIAGPIQHAADHALDRLVDELIEELGLGRPDLVARLLGAAPEAWPDAERRDRGAVGTPVMAEAAAGEPDWDLPVWGDGLEDAAPDDAAAIEREAAAAQVALVR